MGAGAELQPAPVPFRFPAYAVFYLVPFYYFALAIFRYAVAAGLGASGIRGSTTRPKVELVTCANDA